MTDDTVNGLQTAADVIEALGGNKPVGALTNTRPKTVSMWRRNGLPPETYLALSSALARIGIHAPPSLWKQRGVG